MVIDHIGILVRSLEHGIKHWEAVFGYKQATEVVENTRQRVKVVFLKKENSLPVKLIAAVDERSPIYNALIGLHHLCFRCDSVNEELQRMQEMGLRVLAQPQPGEAFENENIAFVFAKQGLNIELIDTDKRAMLLDKNSTS